MIIGSVLETGDAVIGVTLRGPSEVELGVEAVVDTGFNDFLTLTSTTIEQLGLTFREYGRFTLADGTESASRLFTADVSWCSGWRRILVIEMDGGPLVGMALLRGTRLEIDVIPSGRVSITPLGLS